MEGFGISGIEDLGPTTRDLFLIVRSQQGQAMAQAVSRRPLTAVAWVCAQVNPVGFVVDKVALGQVFLRVLQFSHQYHFTMGSTFPKIKKK
jgi:hypothetical protein